jgi:DNA-binding protein, excisionase family
MNAFELNRNASQARIFSIDRSIAVREDEVDNAEEFARSFGRLLSPSEVAELIGLSRSTVYKLIERDQIPHIKIGRSVRIEENDLYRTLAANRVAVT